jgi:hypothetical protein
VIGLALRRWPWQAAAADFGQPTASTTRWRVSALPSMPLPVPGVGRARWRLKLLGAAAGKAQNSRSRLVTRKVSSLFLAKWLADLPESGRACRHDHRRGTATSLFAGCLNSFATISMASRSSTASILPTHSRFAASL